MTETTTATALDGAMHSVWLHGKWRWLTSNMTTEQKEAAADAVERHSTSLNTPGDEDPIAEETLRWWRETGRGDAYRFAALAKRDPEMAATLGQFWWQPFNERRVAILTAYQHTPRFPPYICGQPDHPPLVPWIGGWRCDGDDCAYTQDWAHPVAEDVAVWLLAQDPS